MAIFKILKVLESKLIKLNTQNPRFCVFKFIHRYKIKMIKKRIAELKNELYIRKHETH